MVYSNWCYLHVLCLQHVMLNCVYGACCCTLLKATAAGCVYASTLLSFSTALVVAVCLQQQTLSIALAVALRFPFTVLAAGLYLERLLLDFVKCGCCSPLRTMSTDGLCLQNLLLNSIYSACWWAASTALAVMLCSQRLRLDCDLRPMVPSHTL